MPTSQAANGQPVTNEGGRVKQTRRRQRLSCVECTKRRQKCDRQIPCGLCTTRGIAHLCRWEPIVVRPAPQRPPIAAVATADASANDTIQALSQRIAVLEQALLKQNLLLANGSQSPENPPDTTLSPDDQRQRTNSPSPPVVDPGAAPDDHETGSPRALYDFNVQVAAVALAQLSLAPREEYVGAGTVLCALHKLGDPDTWRFPYSHSSSMTSPGPSTHPFAAPVRTLLAQLPSHEHTEALVAAFFAQRNWEFGLPAQWFRSALARMARHLAARCPATGEAACGCGACAAREEVNPHWLALLFAVLALSPAARANEGGGFFAAALAARRLVEDMLLALPAYDQSEGSVHGAVLTCIGTALLAAYHADRGRVSEAWKLAGSGMRTAQAMGLHRDPGWRKWETMGKEEMELRLLGWWSLWVADRIYSFILGRPMMAPKGSFDVTLLPGPVHSDGSPNPHAAYQRALIHLCEIIGEGADKCLGIHTPSYATVLEFDHRFRTWRSQLPPELQWSGTRPPTPTHSPARESLAERSLAYQRDTLAAWYLGGLMNIHRPYLMHPPPILPPPAPLSGAAPRVSLNPSRERCIELALELVRVLCRAHDGGPGWAQSPPATAFQYAYFLFDGAVALAGALSQTPPHPRADECLALMDRAVRMLDACVAAADGRTDGEGEMAKRAITVLGALRRAGGWGRGDAPRAASPHEDARMHTAFAVSHSRAGEFGSPASDHAAPHSAHSSPRATADSPPSSDDSSVQSMIHNVFYPAPTSSGLYAGSLQPPQPPPPPLHHQQAQQSFIPYLNAPAHYAQTPMPGSSGMQQGPYGMDLAALYPGAAAYAGSMAGTSALNPPPQGWGGGGLGLGLGVGFGGVPPASKMSAQTMMMPFEMLQGRVEFDAEWARLAGMENWQNGAAFLPSVA